MFYSKNVAVFPCLEFLGFGLAQYMLAVLSVPVGWLTAPVRFPTVLFNAIVSFQ